MYDNLSHRTTPGDQSGATSGDEGSRYRGQELPAAALGGTAPATVEAAAETDDDERRARCEREIAMAIFEIGLRHSSPKVIKALLGGPSGGDDASAYDASDEVTTEHIKSHLQKYRQHHAKNKEGFLGHYAKHLLLDKAQGASEDEGASQKRPATAAPEPLAPKIRKCEDRGYELEQLEHIQNVQETLITAQEHLHEDIRADLMEHATLQSELEALYRTALPPPPRGGGLGGVQQSRTPQPPSR